MPRFYAAIFLPPPLKKKTAMQFNFTVTTMPTPFTMLIISKKQQPAQSAEGEELEVMGRAEAVHQGLEDPDDLLHGVLEDMGVEGVEGWQSKKHVAVEVAKKMVHREVAVVRMVRPMRQKDPQHCLCCLTHGKGKKSAA